MKRFFTIKLFHRKDGDVLKLQLLLFSILFFASIPNAQAQCPAGCNSNYGLNSNNVASEIEYDNMVSGFANNAIREADGTFKVWGMNMMSSGAAGAHALSPQVINSTNYPGLQGTVLKIALTGVYDPGNQAVILTTEGIYAWGTTNLLVSPTVKSTTAFGRVSIAGSNTYDLPPGVTPQQVKSFFGSHSTIALLTCTGEAWVLSMGANTAGAGLATANNSWNRVTTSEAGNPTLDNVIALRGAYTSLIALRADGTLWTWGNNTYLGDGTAYANRSRATKMTLPNPVGTIKMIGMTCGISSYYILYTDGNLYTMGDNSYGQLGDWTTVAKTTWVQPRYNSASGTLMNNITWISPSEHAGGTNSPEKNIGVLTNAGQVYNWGSNFGGQNNSNYSNHNPSTPNTDRMLAVESGQNQTMVIRACNQNYGWAGSQYYGNIGDGVGRVNVYSAPYNYTTASVNVCGVNAMTTAGVPVFNAGLPTSRCSGAGTVTYTATSSGGTVSYSLSPAAAGTINTSTGAVTYNAGWSGTAVITATANGGCGTPETATLTVTVAATPAAPVFGAGLSAARCTGAGTVTYAATAANADSITYSIANTGTGTQPTINPATGEVTYAANWNGTSTITATASGCSTTSSSTYVVNTAAVQAIADSASGDAATPLAINVLANDLCNPNPNTLTIVTQPANGTLQISTGGIVTYLPNGDFSGTDTFVYQVCTALSGVCSQATVTINIAPNLNDVCSTASLPKTFYLPFPENTELKKALRSAGNTTSNNTASARKIIGIRANYSNTVIYYDHWEDGYEPTVGSRTQTTTEVWGDGNTTNGIAPGYPTDVFPEGAIITIDNTYAYRTGNGRTPTDTAIQYDGRDKIYSTKLLTLTKVTGSDASFTVQSTKGNVIDTNKFGRLFVVPFGENINTLANPSISTTVFNYTSLFVTAAENGTVVQLDYNGDGTIDVTSPTLSEGMVWFYDGTAATPGNASTDVNKANDIKSGATITSNKPVGVDLVFGGIDAYGTRNIPLLPGSFYGSTYYSPVYTASASEPVYAVFSNILSDPITVNWKNGLGSSGTITIPAKGYTSLQMSQATGYRFESANGKSYTAVTIIDADTTGSAYDWAFNMIPENQLTNFTTTAWAPGLASGGAANPLWVTPTKGTTVYVKYSGSVITTASGSISPCGLKYDAAFPLSALQSQKIFTSTGNSGMSLFTCDGTPISAVYGQDSSVAAASGTNTLDVGFTLDPQCIDFVIFANDDRSQTYPNMPVVINILDNDIGRVSPNTVTIVSPPSNGTVVTNPDGTVTYTPKPGFSGTDTFSYQVCNSDRSLCSTAIVTVDVGCLDTELKHILTGKIFDDANKNGVYENGEGGVAHTVNLYLDTNGNGVLDTAESTPIQSVTTNNTGAYVFERPTPTPVIQASHDFSTASYTAGTGWSTGWTETGDGTSSPTAGNIQILNGELRFTGDTAASISRSVTAPINNAQLSFSFKTANLDGLPSEKLEIEVAPSATGPWTLLGTLNSITGFTNGTKVYNIPPAAVGPGMTIRFRTSGIDGDYFYIDDVTIQSIPTVNYIVQLAEPLPAGSSQTLPVLPQKGYALALSGYKTTCNNNFGIVLCPIATTTPAVKANISIQCPSSSVNLNTHAYTGVTPANTVLLWFTDAARTTMVTNPEAVGAGTYYAFYYSSSANCYSSAAAVTVTATPCDPCMAADPVSVNLNTRFLISGAPSGSVREWHTSATPSASTLISNGTVMATSTPVNYWVFYHDTANNCYSPGTKVVVVSNTCCNYPRVDLTALPQSTPPPGAQIVWYYTNNHTGVRITDPTYVGMGEYFPFFFDPANNCYSPVGTPVLVAADEDCTAGCYKPGATTGGEVLDTKVGITSLQRAGADDPDNWPMVRKGGHIALESKTKAFVPNRVAFSDADNNPATPDVPVGISAADFVEGMMVYDTTNKCLKIYTLKEGDTVMAWHCMTTQACPD
ncbi:MAG: hypothetical protein DI535_27845 [Citrobacter freundii]|nr:MAG: hypothetical protein DI535_27845 [Citrobacter freundii]